MQPATGQDPNLRIASLNINGLNSKLQNINNLLDSTGIDILCLQETKSTNLNQLVCPNFTKIHVSAMDINTDLSNLSSGGLGILIRDNISYERISPTTKPDNIDLNIFSRILSIKLLEFDLILSNIYLPANNSKLSQDENEEKLLQTLAYFDQINDSNTNLICAGDFNSGPKDTDWRSIIIKDHFFPRFQPSDLDYTTEINPYTYTSYAHKSTRRLDRIISTLPAYFTNFDILYKYDCGSDHLPIKASFTVPKIQRDIEKPVIKKTTNKLNWQAAKPKNIRAFQEILTSKIKKITKVVQNLDIDYDEHAMKLFTKALDEAAHDSIPKFKKSHHNSIKPRITKWHEEVEPYKNEVSYWSTRVAMTEKSDSVNYNYVTKQKSLAHSRYRFKLKQQRAITRQNILENISHKNCYKIIKKDDFRQKSAPLDLEGCQPTEQLKKWEKHYMDTFKAKYEPKKIPQDLEDASFEDFNLHELEHVVQQIDTNKSYEHHFHFKHAPKCALRFYLKCINTWAKLPSHLQNWEIFQTKIGPILKNSSKPQSAIKSYRPIASATSEVWVLEKLTIERVKNDLLTKHEQFGYKQGHSTIHCITIANEFKRLEDCHVALLDASSAFDCISHERIIEQLRKRKVDKSLIRLILSLTFNTCFTIKWFGQETDKPFYPYRGVKQGGCLSSFLFSICYDDLIDEIKSLNAGVFINTQHVQLIIYADDILLVASSILGLLQLYDCTIKFTERYSDIKMNPSKSVILRMGSKNRQPVSFYGIPTADTHIYLGAHVGNKNEILERARAKKAIYARTNMLLKGNYNIKSCPDSIKKSYLNAYGGVYGVEYFDKIHSSISRAHRYLALTLWPEANQHRLPETPFHAGGTLLNRTLYKKVADAESIYEVHRKLRNNFILSARASNNPLIRDICGSLAVINTLSATRAMPTTLKYWMGSSGMKHIDLGIFS